jgi:hypothetical protein
MRRSLIVIFLLSFFGRCDSSRCSGIGQRYSHIRAEFEKIETEKKMGKGKEIERRLTILLTKAQRLESDFEGCDIGKRGDITDKLGSVLDAFKISGLRSEIERSLLRSKENGNTFVADQPDDDDFHDVVRVIEKNIQALFSNTQLDDAGNVILNRYAFYIESVKIESVESNISIHCIREEKCISDTLNTAVVSIDYMKSQRLVQYLNDYKSVIICKHNRGGCGDILLKYKD